MYNVPEPDDADRKHVMPATHVNPADPSLHVVDLYARLAAERAVEAWAALRHSGTAGELLAQSAQALEDAAGTLVMLSESYAEDRDEFASLLGRQASALVILAAQFEQAADLARHEGGQR